MLLCRPQQEEDLQRLSVDLHLDFDASAFHAELSDSDGGEASDRAGPRVGSAKWYKDRMFDMIYEGSTMSVLQASWVLPAWKESTGTTDIAFDQIIRIIMRLLKGVGSNLFFPPSSHMIRAILNVPSLAEFEYHVCPNHDHWAWKPLPREEWEANANQNCPTCEGLGIDTPRFKRDKFGNLAPHKVSPCRVP